MPNKTTQFNELKTECKNLIINIKITVFAFNHYQRHVKVDSVFYNDKVTANFIMLSLTV